MSIANSLYSFLRYVRNHREILTITLSLCALFFTSYQAFLQRQHNRVSVQPLIDVYWDNAQVSPHGVFVEAAGIGPAYIREVDATFNSEQSFFDVTYVEYCESKRLDKCGEWPTMPLFFDTGWMSRASLVDPSDKWLLVGIRTEGFKALNWKSQVYLLQNLPNDFVVNLSYCSVYDDCWRASSAGSSVNPVCPVWNGKAVRPCSKEVLADVLSRLNDPL